MIKGMQYKQINISLCCNLIRFSLLSDLRLKQLRSKGCVRFEGRVCRYKVAEHKKQFM